MSEKNESDRMTPGQISRRTLLKLSALTAVGSTAAGLATASFARADTKEGPEILEEATIAGLQAAMASGRLKARTLVEKYLGRINAIDRQGPELRSILETNPDARRIAG